jgi:hypothetical protein
MLVEHRLAQFNKNHLTDAQTRFYICSASNLFWYRYVLQVAVIAETSAVVKQTRCAWATVGTTASIFTVKTSSLSSIIAHSIKQVAVQGISKFVILTYVFRETAMFKCPSRTAACKRGKWMSYLWKRYLEMGYLKHPGAILKLNFLF